MSISVDVAMFVDVAILMDVADIFVDASIVFILVYYPHTSPPHPTPPVEIAALFTIKLVINVDVGIASVHVGVSIVAILLLLEDTPVFYPLNVESSVLFAIKLYINEVEGVYI